MYRARGNIVMEALYVTLELQSQVNWAFTLNGCFWASVIDRHCLPTIDYGKGSRHRRGRVRS